MASHSNLLHKNIKQELEEITDSPISKMEQDETYNSENIELKIIVTRIHDLVEVQITDDHTVKLVFDTSQNWKVTYFENCKYNIKERKPNNNHILKLTERIAQKLNNEFTTED